MEASRKNSLEITEMIQKREPNVYVQQCQRKRDEWMDWRDRGPSQEDFEPEESGGEE